MKIIDTGIPDLKSITFSDFCDKRGSFGRRLCQRTLHANGIYVDWVQSNISKTKDIGTVRGLHFQKNSAAECKFVFCIAGCVLDVAVDLRPNSPSFGKHFALELSSSNNRGLIIPRGFAHGFQALKKDSIIQYFVDNFYDADHEGGLNCLDPDVNISWTHRPINLSLKDEKLPILAEIKKEKYFEN